MSCDHSRTVADSSAQSRLGRRRGPVRVTDCGGSERISFRMLSMILTWTPRRRRTRRCWRAPAPCGIALKRFGSNWRRSRTKRTSCWPTGGRIWTEPPGKRATDAAATAYESLRARLAAEGAGDPSAYGELVQRRQVIEQQLDALKNRKQEAVTLKAQATASLRQLLEIRRELTEARRSFLDRILKNNRYVRIRVIPYGGQETVEAEFRRLIQRDDGRFEKDIGSPGGEGLLGGIYGSSQDATRIEDALEKVKQRIRSIAEGSHSSYIFADQRFATHLSRLQPEALDRVDVWFPDDSLDVQYSPTGDGGNLRSIREGSPGQKTAALLAFLLSYGDEPLVLDQPEDDLDNHLIHELIVKQIRESSVAGRSSL